MLLGVFVESSDTVLLTVSGITLKTSSAGITPLKSTRMCRGVSQYQQSEGMYPERKGKEVLAWLVLAAFRPAQRTCRNTAVEQETPLFGST